MRAILAEATIVTEPRGQLTSAREQPGAMFSYLALEERLPPNSWRDNSTHLDVCLA